MKALRFIPLFLTAVFLLANPILSYASSLSLSPQTGTFNPSCAFSTDIVVNTADNSGNNPINTDGVDVILFYDSSKLSVTSIKNGSIFNDYPLSSFDPQSGKVKISGVDSNQGQTFSGKGTFATINWSVGQTAQQGQTQVNFDFDPNNPGRTTGSTVVDSATISNSLSHVDNGTYTIGSGSGCSGGSTPGPITVSGGVGGTPSGIPTTTTSGTLNKVTGGKSPGSLEGTKLVAIVGSLLTALGIAGLALL